MRLQSRFRVASSLFLVVVILFGLPAPGFGQPPATWSPPLSQAQRERLIESAEDPLLPDWQQEFMAQLARGPRATGIDPSAATAAVAAPTGSVASADGAWWELVVSERSAHTAIYDPVRDRMVILGGSNASFHALNDVWALPLGSNLVWTQLLPTGTPPSGRGGHTAIYDPVRDRMVVFGGTDGYYRNDVYALSLGDSPAWTQLAPTGTRPSWRSEHTAIYDPVRDRMVVFGGSNGSIDLNDVHALSLGGSPGWIQLVPTGAPPGARQSHTASYDPVRDCMVVFGGSNGSSLNRNDVWALSLGGSPAWTQLAPAGSPPGGRRDHAAIYDPALDRMVVFGGSDGPARNDVWALSLGGSPAWTQLAPAGTNPAERYAHTAIHDPVRERMIVFGAVVPTSETTPGRCRWTGVWRGLSLHPPPRFPSGGILTRRSTTR